MQLEYTFFLLVILHLCCLKIELLANADSGTDDIGPLSPDEEAMLNEFRKNQSALLAAVSATTHPRTGFMYEGMNLCSHHDILNGSWVFEGEEKSDYSTCPNALQLSKDIDEASYVCEKYRKAEFNRDNGNLLDITNMIDSNLSSYMHSFILCMHVHSSTPSSAYRLSSFVV